MASVSSKAWSKAKDGNKATTIFKKIKNQIHQWIYRLLDSGNFSSDSEDERLRKAILIFLAGIYSILGLFWSAAYFAFGLPLAGSIPLSYSTISAISLLYFFRTKHYKFFCRIQLVLILILPFLLQYSLGGFTASGAVIIWAILAPIGALMFAITSRVLPWFLAYVVLIVISGFLTESANTHQSLPSWAIIISFVLNIGGVSAIVFFLLKYFVSERERSMLALDEAHKRVRQSLSLAMEVQQNLLPKTDLKIEGLDITGKSIYCDETGGDYYDFLNSGEHGQEKLRVVVGDVSDHGISSALLMATARATIRQRASLPGNISTIVSEVNRQLSYDVEDSGRFMALFFAQIDRKRKSIEWLNAGHTPAVVYDPDSDTFDELSGSRGMPLGIFEEVEYKESQRDVAPGQIIIIATDGIWEAQNPEGVRFGKEQLYNIIRKNASSSAKNIQDSILEALNRFQQDVEPEDDMTLVVVKIE